MNLLELLHNKKVVVTLENIATQIQDLTESDNDFSNVVPSVVMMLEMILNENGRSTVSKDVLVQKEYEDFLKDSDIKKKNFEAYLNSSYQNKSTSERKLTDYLKKELIKNKKLNYGNI